MRTNNSSTNHDEILNKIETYIEQGNFLSAIEEYKKTINTSQTTFTILNNLADLYMHAGKTSHVLKLLYYTIEHYCKNGFTHRAIAIYKKIYRIDPSNASVPLIIGDLYAKLKLNAEAKKWYLLALDFYKTRDQIEDRLELCKKIIVLEDENPTLSLHLAEELQNEGFIFAAYDLYIEIGKELICKGFFEKAIQAYERALVLDPCSKPSLKALALAYTQQNNMPKAIRLLQNALEKMPEDVGLIRTLGYIYLNANLLEQAEATFTNLFNISNLSYDCLLSVAKKYIEQKKYQQAITIIDSCLDILIERQQEIKAISLLTEILNHNPNNLEVIERLITIYRQTCKFDHQALVMDKYVQEAINRGLTDKAINVLNELIMLKPDDSSYIQQLDLLTNPPIEISPISDEVEISPINNEVEISPISDEVEISPINNGEIANKPDNSYKQSEVENNIELEISLNENTNEQLILLEDSKPTINTDTDISKQFSISEPTTEFSKTTTEYKPYQAFQNKAIENNFSYKLDLPLDMFSDISEAKLQNDKDQDLLEERLSLLPQPLSNDGNKLNLPYFDKVLQREWKRAMRNLKPISLVLIKAPCYCVVQEEEFNICIHNIINTLNNNLHRPGDLTTIYNHYYLAIILPETTKNGAEVVVKRLFSKIETLRLAPFGIATSIPKLGSLPNIMIEKAKQQLLTTIASTMATVAKD